MGGDHSAGLPGGSDPQEGAPQALGGTAGKALVQELAAQPSSCHGDASSCCLCSGSSSPCKSQGCKGSRGVAVCSQPAVDTRPTHSPAVNLASEQPVNPYTGTHTRAPAHVHTHIHTRTRPSLPLLLCSGAQGSTYAARRKEPPSLWRSKRLPADQIRVAGGLGQGRRGVELQQPRQCEPSRQARVAEAAHSRHPTPRAGRRLPPLGASRSQARQTGISGADPTDASPTKCPPCYL